MFCPMPPFLHECWLPKLVHVGIDNEVKDESGTSTVGPGFSENLKSSRDLKHGQTMVAKVISELKSSCFFQKLAMVEAGSSPIRKRTVQPLGGCGTCAAIGTGHIILCFQQYNQRPQTFLGTRHARGHLHGVGYQT